MFLKRIFLTATIFLFTLSFYGTHIVGGELSYECLGGNNYKIILKIYRDCFNGQAPFDNPAPVGVFNSNGLLYTLLLTLPPTTPITTPPSPCFVPPTNVCVEEAVYSIIINLPPIPGGYTFVYQRCCRNNTILNVANPGNVGATYFTNIQDTSIVKCNNSPYFKNFPPLFLCVGSPINFDHSAIDTDGDSLVYFLCDTYAGASSAIPAPNPPASPPYAIVSWASGYSGGNPMSASPLLSIDPGTGLMKGTPTQIGQYVVGVCVNEYRNGVFIGTHKRDFQFNVINCTAIPIVSIPGQNSNCSGKTVVFQNNSSNGTTFHWDFGVAALTNDTSNLITPTYTYADTGSYEVSLTVNPGSGCESTGKTTFSVYDVLNVDFELTSDQCIVGNGFNFNATGELTNQAQYAWNFGTDANPLVSSLKSPINVEFDSAGAHIVILTAIDHQCTAIHIDTVISVDCRIKVPNVFSPNNDGPNDKFVVKNLEYYPGSRLVIYNRWGRIIYDNSNYLNDWDGNGASDGTYYFILYVSDGRKGIPGFLTIVR